MNFDQNMDVIALLARDRQRAMLQEAAERQIIRRAKEAHPSRGRLARLFRHGPAT